MVLWPQDRFPGAGYYTPLGASPAVVANAPEASGKHAVRNTAGGSPQTGGVIAVRSTLMILRVQHQGDGPGDGGTMITRTALRHTCSVLGLLVLPYLLWSVALVVAQVTPEPVQLILHMLDYVAVDYPEC